MAFQLTGWSGHMKEKWVVEACAQWHYESGVKVVGGRSTTPETGGLGADGLIHLDLSGLYTCSICIQIVLKSLYIV